MFLEGLTFYYAYKRWSLEDTAKPDYDYFGKKSYSILLRFLKVQKMITFDGDLLLLLW